MEINKDQKCQKIEGRKVQFFTGLASAKFLVNF